MSQQFEVFQGCLPSPSQAGRFIMDQNGGHDKTHRMNLRQSKFIAMPCAPCASSLGGNLKLLESTCVAHTHQLCFLTLSSAGVPGVHGILACWKSRCWQHLVEPFAHLCPSLHFFAPHGNEKTDWVWGCYKMNGEQIGIPIWQFQAMSEGPSPVCSTVFVHRQTKSWFILPTTFAKILD